MEASKKFSSTGGKHRARNLTAKQRTKIASKAAKARWDKEKLAGLSETDVKSLQVSPLYQAYA